MTRSPAVVAVFAAAFSAAVALASAARADRLVLSDGRIVEGSVVRDGDVYRVASRFGEAEIAVKDVRDWVKAKSLETEWRERSAKLAPDDHAGRADLAKWLFDSGREMEARALAEQVLALDPESAVAHAVLGHIRHSGAWMSPDDAKRAEGLVEHGGTWYTPEEWSNLDASAKGKAEDASRAAEGRRVAVLVNDATRLMLAPDPALRAEGKRRLEALARENKSDAIAKLVTQVKAYADAMDAYIAAESSATVLAECRIQLARLKRPIQSFSTSLASNLNSAPVVIQLPEVEIIKLNTTVGIPAGTER
jgi:hypothetical protein